MSEPHSAKVGEDEQGDTAASEPAASSPELETTDATGPPLLVVELDEDSAPEDAAPEDAASNPAEDVVGQGNLPRLIAFAVLPAVALLLLGSTGFLKWQDSGLRTAQLAQGQSVQAAKDGAVALLSYQPDTAEAQLTAARDLLTGGFRDSYVKLTNDVVIPGAKKGQVTATATVPAASSVSASAEHAVAMVFVDQTMVAGTGIPSNRASTVRVTLDKVDGRWLISAFDPI